MFSHEYCEIFKNTCERLLLLLSLSLISTKPPIVQLLCCNNTFLFQETDILGSFTISVNYSFTANPFFFGTYPCSIISITINLYYSIHTFLSKINISAFNCNHFMTMLLSISIPFENVKKTFAI